VTRGRVILVEAAVETVAQARRAVADGASRLELCAALADGGVTPDVALVRAVRAAVAVPLHVLIRPRPGDFVYSSGEVRAMCESVRALRAAGADAVVVGALTVQGAVDVEALAAMAEAAGSTPLVGHRAVDTARDAEEAIEACVTAGLTRVLTSGGAATAADGAPVLKRLVTRFARRVTILAGGGVRAGNVQRLVAETGVREIHAGFPVNAEVDRIRDIVAALH
jgi:copper homeostasis protein